MSEVLPTSVLRDAALASGLVSQQQLDDALAGLKRALPVDAAGPAVITDYELGQRLVDLGYLNRWQVEQLKEGRKKFTLGPYRIVDAIGKGGMGHVFKAEHKLLGRIEAVKVLPKHRSTPEAIISFQREIRAQAQLDHPNLVRATYADHDGDTFFFVTEYVPGTDLRKLVRRNGPLSSSIAATIISKAAVGLHYAHRKGLVHRDVKPGNLLVTPDGITKVTDLGLAWFVMDEFAGPVPETSRTLVGTADYMAPETITNPERILPVSDIYSLGCTLYYAVTGKVPFPGGSTAEKMQCHLTDTPLNPLHFNPDLPAEFCDVIASMMDKDLDSRVPTAAAVVERLEQWCDPEATQIMAERPAPASGIFHSKPGRQPPPPPESIAETAEHVLSDDDELTPLPVDSPSQISQPTTPIASETEETSTDVDQPSTRTAPAVESADTGPLSTRRAWLILLGALAVIAAAAALATLL